MDLCKVKINTITQRMRYGSGFSMTKDAANMPAHRKKKKKSRQYETAKSARTPDAAKAKH